MNCEFDALQTEIEEVVPLAELPEQYKERKTFSDTFYRLQSNAKIILNKATVVAIVPLVSRLRVREFMSLM